MSTTPPLATRIAELHREHHLRLSLTTGAARCAAPARMPSKKNKKTGAGLYARPAVFEASLFVGFLYNVDRRFAGFNFYPPDKTTRPALFDR